MFDGISKTYLESMVLAISTEKDSPKNLFESYTFNFNYHEADSQNVNKLSDFDIVDGRGYNIHSVSAADAKRSMQLLFRRTVYITQNLDPLPTKRYVFMKLFWNDCTPQNYEPPFFRPAKANENLTYNTGDTQMPPICYDCGTMYSGWHGFVETLCKYH